jgi:hypothetical protein
MEESGKDGAEDLGNRVFSGATDLMCVSTLYSKNQSTSARCCGERLVLRRFPEDRGEAVYRLSKPYTAAQLLHAVREILDAV